MRYTMASSSATSTSIRCHYDVLQISQDADAATIKKAHRKLALQLHPDKNLESNNTTDAEFLLVQQAYECLSDPQERKWYDDHRVAILRGWKSMDSGGYNDDDDDANTMNDILFNVGPYMMANCYAGYDKDDDNRSFYSVYNRVFQTIYQEELEHSKQQSIHLKDDFGSGDSPWEHVSSFYASWEGFSSVQSFAWADQYDVTQADHRQVRRGMEEENKKYRKAAKKMRNDDILALVHFVKRRDPRVKQRKLQQEREQAKKEAERKKQEVIRKQESLLARQEWRAQADAEQSAVEEADLLAGRIRLADLDDDYDYGSGGKKGKKKQKKKRKNKFEEDSDDGDCGEEQVVVHDGDDEQVTIGGTESYLMQNDGEDTSSVADDKITGVASAEETAIAEPGLEDSGDLSVDVDKDSSDDDSDDDDEPDIWRCECCRKDFKSEGQFENHLNSKNHKVTFKKWSS
jgi:DnaJ family protein A protein 5